MRIVLQGSLQYFAAKELLLFLAKVPSGTVDAESGGVRLRLALRDGKVVWTEGDSDATAVVERLLGWSDGTFNFLDEIATPAGVTPLALEIGPLIAQAEERNAEARKIIALYPDDSIGFRVAARPPEQVNLTGDEFQILFQIGNGKSLARLRSDSGRPPVDLYPIIKRLHLAGLIESLVDLDATGRQATPRPKQASAPHPTPKSEPAIATAAAPEKALPASAAVPHEVATPPAQIAPGNLLATLTANDGIMHPLLDETATIGRTSSNTIALPDGSVSAKHALITRTADGFLIEDLGSRNGTFVNSEKLAAPRLLVDGDLIRFGKILLAYNLAAELPGKQTTASQKL